MQRLLWFLLSVVRVLQLHNIPSNNCIILNIDTTHQISKMNEDQGNTAGPAAAVMVRYSPSNRYIELTHSEPLCRPRTQRESP